MVAVSSALSLNMLQCMPLPQSRKALVLKKNAVFINVMLETLSCAWKLLGSLIFRTGTWKEYITRHHLGRWSNGRWHTFVLIQDVWVVYGDCMHIAFFVTECIGFRLHNGAWDVLTEIPHQLMQWCALHEAFWWPLMSKEVFLCYFAFAQQAFEKLSMHGGKNYDVSSTECNVAYVPCTEG